MKTSIADHLSSRYLSMAIDQSGQTYSVCFLLFVPSIRREISQGHTQLQKPVARFERKSREQELLLLT
jgi:hypothetical protein